MTKHNSLRISSCPRLYKNMYGKRSGVEEGMERGEVRGGKGVGGKRNEMCMCVCVEGDSTGEEEKGRVG